MSRTKSRTFNSAVKGLEDQLVKDFYLPRKVRSEFNGYLATLRDRGVALLESGSKRRDTGTFYAVWDAFSNNELSICSVSFFDVAIAYVQEHFKEAHRLLSVLISEEIEVSPEFEAAAERIADEFASLKDEIGDLKKNVVRDDGSIDFEKMSDVVGRIRQFSASLRDVNHPIFESKRFDKQTQKQNEYNCKVHVDNCWKCLTHSSEVPERDADYDPWNGDHLRTWRRLIGRTNAVFEELFPRGSARKVVEQGAQSALDWLDTGDQPVSRDIQPRAESETPPSVSEVDDNQDEVIRALKREIRQLKRQVRDLMMELEDEKEKNRNNLERLRKAASKKTEMELQQENDHLKDKIKEQAANIETLKGSIAHLQAILRYRAVGNGENDAVLEDNVDLRKRNEMLRIEVEKLKEQIQEQLYRDDNVVKLGSLNEIPSGSSLPGQYKMLQEQNLQLQKQMDQMNVENLLLRKKAAKKRQYKQDAKVALEGKAEIIAEKEKEREEYERKLKGLAEVQQNNANLKSQLVVLQKKLDSVRRSSMDQTAGTDEEKARLEDTIAALKKNEEYLSKNVNKEKKANADLTKQIEKLENEQTRLKGVVKEKDQEIETLLDQLHTAGAAQQKFDDLQKSTSKLRQSQNLSEQKILDYEMQLAEMNRIKTENQGLAKKLEMAEEKAKAHKTKATEQEKLIKDQALRIKELETEADVLRTRTEDQDRLLRKLQKGSGNDQDEKLRQMLQEKDDLYSQLVSSKSISMELIKLKAELDSKDDEIAELKIQLAKEGTINKDLSKEVKDLKDKLKSKKKSNENDDVIEELNNQIQTLNAQVLESKKLSKALQQQLDESEEQRNKLQPMLEKTKSELDEQKEKVSDLKTELETRDKELSRLKEALDEKEKSLSKELKKLQKTIQSKEDEIAERERQQGDDESAKDQEIKDLRQQVKDLQDQLDDLENEKNSDITKSSKLKRKLEKSQARIEEMEQEQQERDEQMQQLQAALKKSKQRINDLKAAQQDEDAGKTSELDQALKAAKEEIEELKAQSAEYYEAYSELRSENSEMRAKIERMETRNSFFDPLKENIKKYTSVSRKYYELKQVIDTAEEDAALLEVNGKTRDREEVEKKLSKLSNEHDELFRELVEASEKCAQKEYFIMERLDADLQEDLSLAYDYIKQLRAQIKNLMSSGPNDEEPDERVEEMSSQVADMEDQLARIKLSITKFEQEMQIKPKKKYTLAKRILNLKRATKDRTSFQLYPRESSEY